MNPAIPPLRIKRFHHMQSLDISIKYRDKLELHVYSSTVTFVFSIVL